MKYFAFILAVVMLTACRSVKEATHRTTDHASVFDTVHVVEAKTHHDSIHTEITTTQRVQVVEEYDDTGKLRRRVIESEATVKELRDALRELEARLDSMSARSIEETHDLEETEKEAEPVSPSPFEAMRGILAGAVGVLLFFLALKIYPNIYKLFARNADS